MLSNNNFYKHKSTIHRTTKKKHINLRNLEKNNKEIIHDQSEWHEVQPSASNEVSVLLLLSNLGRKHILMARSKAEGTNF